MTGRLVVLSGPPGFGKTIIAEVVAAPIEFGGSTVRSVTVVTPTSSLGGRRFEPRAELTLHELARTAAATLPGVADEVLLVPEMPNPLGLPDFIALGGGSSWLGTRQAAGIQPVLSESECSVLAALHPGQTHVAPVGGVARAGDPVPGCEHLPLVVRRMVCR